MELAYSNASSASTSPPSVGAFGFTNTAKLPIETVKRLIAAVSRRPILWMRTNANGQKRSDITPIWFDVGKDVNLPADVCRVKWGHLRDNFRKVYIRNNLSNESPSSWRFYNDMRFMEHAVHENIMRQARTRGSSSSSKKHPPIHWTENNNHILDDSSRNKYDEPIVATEPICELSDSYDSELHQPSFSDISSFFEEEQHQQRDCKRVKLEDVQSSKGEELNDDDFDEDAASETEEEQRPDPSVFTIEVLDDEDEDVQQSKEKPTVVKTEEDQKPAALQDLPFKYISMDAATNTEPNGQDIQDDADRMFLLSLMPFLQRLDERRKLRVRQKLQNVLIEELEFG
ncbi:uncharacterized protein LOC6578302 [Drosophila mojavensis]|uniref:BESS domain-containing protein n=1 Tax=Drosophila mojavensis TaxID=7230 RepID=B4KQ50_DROMO|nr:uncharacterized protein LOC6578302 [Drosophila mojavensis]XP_032586465.1 uncharacterized protein LOC6578302 [Drosophila mojavensis]XP_043866567.1 uncharacterized protein LOC6578302 [Drosophila mojavensis]EDW08152.1 uncharacterized protein Dmoj_GI19796 [Drosophila mojavensis]